MRIFMFVIPVLLLFEMNPASGQTATNHDLFIPLTQAVPKNVKSQYDLLDTIKTTHIRHKNKSNIVQIKAGVLESIYDRKTQAQNGSNVKSNIEDFVILNIPKIGKVRLVIDSIYEPKPIFSPSHIDFTGVFCHVEGMLPKINELAWTHGGIGGIINIPEQGEIHIINLGNGYQCFAEPYMASDKERK